MDNNKSSKVLKSSISMGFNKIVTPYEVLDNGIITLEGEYILSIGDNGISNNEKKLDFSFDNYIVYPALINSHDHLLGSYYPRVGDRKPYFSWKLWDDDLKSSSVYSERSKIDNVDLYYLGSFRNMISGVLTVSDHIPHSINDPMIPIMPIRIIKDYALAHEVSEYDLKWGEGVEIEHKKAINNNEPFITHIEEGFDEESMKGVEYLLEMEALSNNTVLIHGIALSDEDIKMIAKHRAHLVWCPFSNFYMFERTARVKEILDIGVNISIGTDSPMSGSLHILEEVKFAKNIFYDMYKEDLSDELITKMITVNPAKALRIDNLLGSISKGKRADFILIKDKGADPYSTLVEANQEDIALIFYGGKPLYGNEDFSYIFDSFNVDYSKLKVNNVKKIISGYNPLDLLKKIRKIVGFEKDIPFLPVG